MQDKVDWAVTLALTTPAILAVIVIAIGLMRGSFRRPYETHDSTAIAPDGIIAAIDSQMGPVIVSRSDGLYTVTVNGIDRHPNISADEAIGAMANYLHGAEYRLSKVFLTEVEAQRLIRWCAQLTYEMSTEASPDAKWRGLEPALLEAFMAGRKSTDAELIALIPYLEKGTDAWNIGHTLPSMTRSSDL